MVLILLLQCLWYVFLNHPKVPSSLILINLLLFLQMFPSQAAIYSDVNTSTLPPPCVCPSVSCNPFLLPFGKGPGMTLQLMGFDLYVSITFIIFSILHISTWFLFLLHTANISLYIYFALFSILG
ncbi:unnamed protein product [Rangifer tarandus platyrhynchus]|uniref:Uncharacterized protein n=1 Tax=Rangifer tarandus platyrhynchus TaxID=3082113 RepID=A0ABN8XT28_RANTA|nr:unnamed protein product [Rangifer tarandus platyrhynchus]